MPTPVPALPDMQGAPEITPLFATPLVTFEVPEAAALNSELRRVSADRGLPIC